MSVFLNNNKKGNMTVKFELNNKKGNNMELVDINVVIECGKPQMAIGSDKIIGYDEIEVCGNCGAIIRDKNHKYCTQCGTKVREVKTSQQPIKVLDLTLEQFEELIDKEVFFIETKEIEVHPNFETKYTESELLEKINDLIGILNIKEAKEFIFKYGDRKNENEEVYNHLLLQQIIESDEVVDKEITIIVYYYKDSIGTELGSWDYRAIIGYDLKY